MLFKRPTVWDKPITLFKLDNDIALHFIQSKSSGSVKFYTSLNTEKLVIALKGFVKALGFDLYEKDILYVPRGIEDIEVQLWKGSVVYIVEAPSEIDWRPYVKRFKEAQYVDVGNGCSLRRRYILIGLEDISSRFIAGYTMCSPGCWGSYPPHRHDDKYEIFVYFDVEPGFGVQLLIDEDTEKAYIVKDLDVFLVTRGYHPNVSIPLKGLNYLWIMISISTTRDFSMKVHEVFQKPFY